MLHWLDCCAPQNGAQHVSKTRPEDGPFFVNFLDQFWSHTGGEIGLNRGPKKGPKPETTPLLLTGWWVAKTAETRDC